MFYVHDNLENMEESLIWTINSDVLHEFLNKMGFVEPFVWLLLAGDLYVLH